MAWSMALLGYPYGSFGLEGDYWIGALSGTGTDVGYSIAVDSNGNYYVLGYTTSIPNASSLALFLAKYDSLGAVQWSKTLDGSSVERGLSVAIDSADHVYVLGQTNTVGSGNYDFLIAKYSPAGGILWARTLGGFQNDYGFSIAIDNTDNIYVTGETLQRNSRRQDLLFAKYDSNGFTQWYKVVGSAGYTYNNSVTTDSQGYIYTLGEVRLRKSGSKASYFSQDFSLIKYDSNGTIQWQRNLGGSSGEFGEEVAVDSSDNVYAVGYTSQNNILIVKYNSSGTVQWQSTLSGVSVDRALSVAIDSNDNFYVVGYTYPIGESSTAILLLKFNSSGVLQWQRWLGGASTEEGHSVAIDSSDNILITGQTNSMGNGLPSFLVAKLPNDGSGIGTYVLNGVNMVYGASSLTQSSLTLASAASSLTPYSVSISSRIPSLTSSSPALPDYIVRL